MRAVGVAIVTNDGLNAAFDKVLNLLTIIVFPTLDRRYCIDHDVIFLPITDRAFSATYQDIELSAIPVYSSTSSRSYDLLEPSAFRLFNAP